MKISRFNESLNEDKFKKCFKNYPYLDNANKLILYGDIDRINKFEIKFDMYYTVFGGKDIYLSINVYLKYQTEGFPLKNMGFSTDDSELMSLEELKEIQQNILNSKIWHTIKKEDVDQLIDTVNSSNKFNI